MSAITEILDNALHEFDQDEQLAAARRDGSLARRKALMVFEFGLERVSKIVQDPETNPAVVLQYMQSLSKWAGQDTPQPLPGAAAFGVQIILPGGGQVNAMATLPSQAPVIDVVPTIVFDTDALPPMPAHVKRLQLAAGTI